jgi:hypothetical protein
MAAVVIQKLSELGMDCWNPARQIGECHECSRVDICKLDEAKHGRLVIANKKLAKGLYVYNKLKQERKMKELLLNKGS